MKVIVHCWTEEEYQNLIEQLQEENIEYYSRIINEESYWFPYYDTKDRTHHMKDVRREVQFNYDGKLI